MKFILTVVFIFLSFLGCKKSNYSAKDSYSITVQVKDKDNQSVIADAKVRVIYLAMPQDSAITNANGIASFTYKKETGVKLTTAQKTGYVIPPFIFTPVPLNYEDRTDIRYLAKASYVNITAHQANAWLSSDTFQLQVKYDYNSDLFSSDYRTAVSDKANGADKILNLNTYYNNPGFTKMYFKWDIIRSSISISSKTDSTDLIQYGTKNFTINY